MLKRLIYLGAVPAVFAARCRSPQGKAAVQRNAQRITKNADAEQADHCKTGAYRLGHQRPLLLPQPHRALPYLRKHRGQVLPAGRGQIRRDDTPAQSRGKVYLPRIFHNRRGTYVGKYPQHTYRQGGARR